MKFLVVGTLAFDFVGRVDRFPGANESTRLSTLDQRPGGGAGTACATLASLGESPAVLACVGADFAGSDYESELLRLRVDTSGLVRTDGLTARAFIFDRTDATQMMFFFGGTPRPLNRGGLQAEFAHFGPGEIREYPGIMKSCNFVSFDAGQAAFYGHIPDMLACLPHVDLFSANEHEFAVLAEKGLTEATCFEQGVRAIIITRSIKGATLILADGTRFEVPAVKANVIDPTGAGDAFRAGVVWGIASGGSMVEAMRLGAVLGAGATEGVGPQTSLLDREEAIRRFERHFGKWPFQGRAEAR